MRTDRHEMDEPVRPALSSWRQTTALPPSGDLSLCASLDGNSAMKYAAASISRRKRAAGEERMASVDVVNVRKAYGGLEVIHGVSIDIADGEFVTLVGPSGCGKSTLLRMIAGLEEISGGDILIDEKVVNDLPPKERDIAMVFQNYALYPHMTVNQNMAFSLKMRRATASEIDVS